MTTTKPLTVSFKDIDKDDLHLVGGKGANLGEMVKAGFPVPSGFVVTVHSYEKFLAENNLTEEIITILKETDVNKPDELEKASKQIQGKIKHSNMPKDIALDIVKAYHKLSGTIKRSLMAVRSSATAEDLPGASFASQQETFLNIKGDTNILVAVRDCWASLFTPRAIFYREQNKIPHNKVKMAVIVQEMLQSDVSGVMFTLDPVMQDKDKIVIEAIWGLGELIVQGVVIPDRYIVQKETFYVLAKSISQQQIQLVKKGAQTKEVEVPEKLADSKKLSDGEIVALARLGDRLQKHYYFPQDVEWAKKGNKLYIVQTRPVTTLKDGGSKRVGNKGKLVQTAGMPILTGIPASPGIGTGRTKVLKSPKELNKVRTGDVLVAKMTSPDYVPAMKKAVAIVTDEGGMTSHAAIVSRELGVPCVVGTKKATTSLKANTVVSVDGSKGLVFLGSEIKIEKALEPKMKREVIRRKTATKLYVNLAEKELANKVSKLNVDGVGLLRAEFMIADIGVHPKEAIKQKKQLDFIGKLSRDLAIFCKAFGNRPVVYRATDFKTNEYRSLSGGEAWEPIETNPMLGFRGAFRYIANPNVFNLELQAIKKVRKKYKNLWLMIPFVRTPEELVRVRRMVAAERFFAESTFKFWMMVELPVNVILIEDFIKVGIDGISIGSNDLTMLLSGTDRDNADVSEVFDERSPAVLWALRKVIKACKKHGVTSSICGQAPSVYDDLVEKLVRYGITSISVNPDAVNRVRGVIYETEKSIATRN
ncbi:phosphoenolpyruvate synthase [Patescibacteria group bacterium]|nr:phosphoenolpyruvate synthase [Patescibacteria group bacterium]